MITKFKTTSGMPETIGQPSADASGDKLVNLILIGLCAYALFKFVIKPEIDKANYMKLQANSEE